MELKHVENVTLVKTTIKVERKTPKCTSCGFHIRGKGHEEGSHHKGKRGK